MANGVKWFNVNETRTINNLALPEQTICAKFFGRKISIFVKNTAGSQKS
jgi:hypothetical protein